ncbi:MAG: hypothetical protein R2712_29395 [Vicinamibacterales bacterium]
MGWLFVSLAVTCTAFGFVDVRDHQDVYVGWRVGHLWFISAAALAALVPAVCRHAGPHAPAVDGAGAADRRSRPADRRHRHLQHPHIFNWNEDRASRGRSCCHPTSSRPSEWVSANTPADAVFQTDSTARGVEDWP